MANNQKKYRIEKHTNEYGKVKYYPQYLGKTIFGNPKWKYWWKKHIQQFNNYKYEIGFKDKQKAVDYIIANKGTLQKSEYEGIK